MPEKQDIYSIEKQEAGQNIYNIAIQHLATGKKGNLPSIQYALRKVETTKGNFFKNEPEWIDFEKGFIVERKEVHEIANKLDTDKVQIVLGKPASGKSIILKNFGYKLANKNKKIYIVELKKHQIEDVKLYFEAIPQINDDNLIFIVDDAHLYSSECEKLIRDFKIGGKGKLIIGSRPTEEILPTHPKKTSEFQFLNKTEINAEDVAEEMIRTFLKKKHNFVDDRIETVSGKLEKYKNDLWQLSWALNSYKSEKNSVDEEEIYENIMVSITEIETKNRKTMSGEDVFLPLSVFYRYEIPIERKFLEKQLGIKKETIEQLIELSEIVETVEKEKHIMLSLNHSSLAELYFGAYQNYPSLGEEIKEKILRGRGKEDLGYCLFCLYLTTMEPRNSINIVILLGRDWHDEKGGKTLLKELIKSDKIQKSTENEIDMEEDIGKVGTCVLSIAFASKEIAMKLVESIDVDALSSKINKEEDITGVWSCISGIAQANKEVAMKLVESIDVDALSSKINKEEDIGDVWLCLFYIGKVSKEVAMKLLVGIDINALSSKINKEENIGKVESCVSCIKWVSTEAALKLVESFDINALSSKIDREENIYIVGRFVSSISWASEEVVNEIINRLNPKIRKELQKMMPEL